MHLLKNKAFIGTIVLGFNINWKNLTNEEWKILAVAMTRKISMRVQPKIAKWQSCGDELDRRWWRNVLLCLSNKILVM